MHKQTIFFIFILSSIFAFSQDNEPIVQVLEDFKNNKNQYQVDYRILNAIECVTYDVKLILYDKQNNIITAFKLSGDFNSVPGNIMKSIYWDVYKDRENFPEIGKAEVKIVKINKPLVKVLIESSPSGAYVYFGDKFSGFAPLNIEVNEGDYQIRIQEKDYEELKEVVNVTLCEKSLFYTLNRLHYNLSIDSKPTGAYLFIDEVYVSSTPKNLALTQGKHPLFLEKQGYMKRKRVLSIDTNHRSKSYFLKPRNILGIGCIGGNRTLGGEILFFFSRVELDFSIMKTQPFIELPYTNYTSLGYSILIGYRIPYPIDFSIHAGLGLRVFTDKNEKNNSKQFYSFITGVTLPIYFTPGFGAYLKADYWIKTENTDLFLFSGGLICRL